MIKSMIMTAKGGRRDREMRIYGKTGGQMKVLIMTVMMTLPLVAFGQKEEQQQPQQQQPAPTNEAPANIEKEQPAQPAAQPPTRQPEKATDVRAKTDVKEGAQVNRSKTETHAESANDERVRKDVNRTHDENKTKTEAETRSGSSISKTKVNVQEFRSRHAEVFSLGRHPKEFFIQRYGVNHFRLIANTYFIFVDGCWVAVDVDGFGYTERVICEGDPEFVAVVD
jgi:hypothetical protein